MELSKRPRIMEHLQQLQELEDAVRDALDRISTGGGIDPMNQLLESIRKSRLPLSNMAEYRELSNSLDRGVMAVYEGRTEAVITQFTDALRMLNQTAIRSLGAPIKHGAQRKMDALLFGPERLERRIVRPGEGHDFQP